MTKTSLIIEFPTLEDAHEALGRLIGVNTTVTIQPAVAVPPPQQADQKPPRKPRSDAGQPRGPNARTAAGGATPPPPVTPPTVAQLEQPKPAPEQQSKLTVEDGRAAMKRINGTKGLGMEACMAHLREFGVDMISKLPVEKMGEFIAKADVKIAAVKAAAV